MPVFHKLLRNLLLALLLGYWILLATLTHMPRLPQGGPQLGDKTAHFLAYGALGGLLFLTLWTLRPRLPWLPAMALGIALAYGAVDELTQPLSGRICEFGDWLADASGAAIAVASLTIVRLLIMRSEAIVSVGSPSIDASE